jgi:hypothetical protein
MKASLSDIVGTYITNYSEELRKIINEKKDDLITELFIAWNKNEISPELSSFLDELYSKIPTNKHMFCNSIIPKLRECITELPDKEKRQYSALLSKYNTVDSLKLVNRNITKLMVANQNYIFTSEFMEILIRKMYSINKYAYAAESVAIEFFKSKGKTVAKSSKEDDMLKGIDLYVTDQNVQVKYAKKVDVIGSNVLIGSTFLDLSSFEKRNWSYIVFVERNNLYLINRNDILDIRYQVPNYNIIMNGPTLVHIYPIKMNVESFKTEEEINWNFI